MSQKILLIEDEPDIRKTLEYNLSREGLMLFVPPHFLRQKLYKY